MSTDSTIKALTGLQDARGPRGIAARGKNVYKGTSMASNMTMQDAAKGAVSRRMGWQPATNPTNANAGPGTDLYGPVKKEVYAKKALRPNNPAGPAGQPVSGPNLRGAVSRRLRR